MALEEWKVRGVPENPRQGDLVPAGDDTWVPKRKEAYSVWVSFSQQEEANSWNRFYNFLMFSTISSLLGLPSTVRAIALSVPPS